MSKTRTGLLCAIVAICGLVVAILAMMGVLRGGSTDPEAPDPVASADTDSSEIDTLPPSPPVEASVDRSSGGENGLPPEKHGEPPLASIETWGDFLAIHWGARWPEIKAELEQLAPHKLERLERNLPLELLPPPLSDIHGELRDAFIDEFDNAVERVLWSTRAQVWPNPLTSEYLAEYYQKDLEDIDSSRLLQAQIDSEDYRYDLDRLRLEFRTLAWAHLEEKILARDYRACPLVFVDDRSLWPDGVYPGNDIVLTVLVRSWIVTLELYKGEYPEVHELRNELKKLGTEREERILRVLAGKG